MATEVSDVFLAGTELAWWQHAVVYQVYPRSFCDSNGDGVGDLDGVADRIEYLSDVLGVDAVWLSPFYPSPLKDFGYDVIDHTGVAAEQGDWAAFDRLIKTVHQHGLRLIIDYIPNHTSDMHPWFVESRSSRSNPKSDWYVWVDSKPDGSPPNNWLAEPGGSVWQWDPRRQQYYLHSFQVSMPDLNWRNPGVRQAMFDVLRFWLDRGVDGFRIDVAHLILKDPQFRDNPPAPNPEPNPTDRQHIEYTTQLHVHDRGHPDLHEVYRDIRRLLDDYGARTGRARMCIGEIEVMPREQWVTYYGDELDELHFPFNFDLIEVSWTARDVQASVDELEAALPANAWPNYVIGNHDRPRLISRHGPAQARIAAMLLLTLRGTPTLYYGDELGLAEIDIPPDKWLDPLGRDGTRAAMPWSTDVNAGFCPRPATPWLPLPEDWRTRNVAVQLDDSGSLLTLYQRLLALRKYLPALRTGDYRPYHLGNEQCFCYLRSTNRQQVLVALNFTCSAQRLLIPPELRAGTMLLSTWLDAGPAKLGHQLVLRPAEGVVIEVPGEVIHV